MYKQIDGVAMGSQLGPALANISVGFYETKLISNANKPHRYHRYVDDTFVALNSEKEYDDFFHFSQLPSPSIRLILRRNVMVLFPF